jgi:hypothetical protein
MTESLKRAAAVVAVLAVLAAPAVAQSVTSVQGLGYPLVPTDARADAMGGLGIGLQGFSPTLLNPASAAGVQGRGAVVSVAAVEQAASLGDASDNYGATRFPLIQVLYPMRGVVFTAGYGGYLDQSWAVVREATEMTGGQTFTYRDFVRSTGGIGELQVGLAVPIGDRLALGAALGTHTGSQRVLHQRTFDSTSLGTLQPFSVTRAARYSGPLARIGARWDPIDVLRLAASVKWAASLQADSTEGRVQDREVDLPLEVAGGVSAYLSPNLLASVSGRWTDWSTTGEVGGAVAPGIQTSEGRETWEVGGGLEYDNPARRAARSFPVRLGFQYRQLPFTFVEEAPTEWWAGGGIGMRVGPDTETPVIRVDLTVQRGERSTPAGTLGELTESAWRVALSLSIFGN